MKLKSNVITGIVIACFLLGGITTTLHAQGIYSNKATTTTTTTTSSESGLNRAFGDGGTGGTDTDPNGTGGTDPGSEPTPVGEGIVILSLLSGAYALVKRNIKNRHED